MKTQILSVDDFQPYDDEKECRRRTYTNGKAMVFVWPKGETVLDNLQNRRSRPSSEWKKIIHDTVAIKLESDPNKMKLLWDQKLGCDCGCSPGFAVYGFTDKKSNDYRMTVPYKMQAHLPWWASKSRFALHIYIGTEDTDNLICDIRSDYFPEVW